MGEAFFETIEVLEGIAFLEGLLPKLRKIFFILLNIDLWRLCVCALQAIKNRIC